MPTNSMPWRKISTSTRSRATTNTAHVLPARMMALLAYRLLKDGGREARQVIADYRAPHTPETYRAYVQSFPD